MKEAQRNIGKWMKRVAIGGALLNPAAVSPAAQEHGLKHDLVVDVSRDPDHSVTAQDVEDTPSQMVVTEQKIEESITPQDDLGPVIDEITTVLGDQYMVIAQVGEDEKQHIDVMAEGGRTVASVFVDGDDLILFPSDDVESRIDAHFDREHMGYVVSSRESVPDLVDALYSIGDQTHPAGQQPAVEEFRTSTASARHVPRSEFSFGDADDETGEEDSGIDETDTSLDTGNDEDERDDVDESSETEDEDDTSVE